MAAFENEFPYKSYSVLDLVHLAYTEEISNVSLLSASIGISCSYHVTLLLHLLHTPCFLIAHNDFYRQKAAALNQQESFTDFLKSHPVPDYSSRISERKVWLHYLTLTLSQHNSVDFIHSHMPPSIALKKFNYKPEAIAQNASMLSQLSAYVLELQKSKDWLEGQWRSAHNMLTLRDNTLNELQKGKDWLEEQWRSAHNMLTLRDNTLNEIHKGKDWLEEQWRSAQELLTLRDNTLSDLEKGKDWLEEQWRSAQEVLTLRDNTLSELQKGKDWLEEQWRSAQVMLTLRDNALNELQKGKDWLEAEWQKGLNELAEIKSQLIYKVLRRLRLIKENHAKK